MKEQVFGICQFTTIPVRKEGKHSAEMVSELLFGEMYEVLEKKGEWLHICVLYDGYLGWIVELQHTHLHEDAKNQLQDGATHYLAEPYLKVGAGVLQRIIPYAAPIPMGVNVCEAIGLATTYFAHRKRVFYSDKQPFSEEVLQPFLGASYLWGGRSIFGIDCSGFAQVVMRLCGVKLRRDASQQYEQGDFVGFEGHQAGDLAFFVSPKGKIDHVGICLSNNRIAHANGFVRIDTLTATGIIREGKCTHPLIGIKRYS